MAENADTNSLQHSYDRGQLSGEDESRDMRRPMTSHGVVDSEQPAEYYEDSEEGDDVRGDDLTAIRQWLIQTANRGYRSRQKLREIVDYLLATRTHNAGEYTGGLARVRLGVG